MNESLHQQTVKLHQQVVKVSASLIEHSAVLATAESCTGGFVSQVLTAIPGASAWFDTGFVTYSNSAKMRQLHVPATTLERFGAVSEAVVLAMVEGALSQSSANVALAISGVAGPDGGSLEKPVGTIWIAWGYDQEGNSPRRKTERYCFAGDRDLIRSQAVVAALGGLDAILQESS